MSIIVKKIQGKEYSFKFNIKTLIRFSELTNNGPGDVLEMFNSNPFLAFRNLLYCAVSYHSPSTGKPINDLPEGFNTDWMGEWIEEMDQDDFNEIQQIAVKSMFGGMGAKAEPDKTKKK